LLPHPTNIGPLARAQTRNAATPAADAVTNGTDERTPLPDPEPTQATPRTSPQFRADRVDTPQQYASWRDYAFSDESPADEAHN